MNTSSLPLQTGLFRWCGHQLNSGFVHCPNCHRAQSRIREVFGTSSSLVSVIAIVITFVQLVLAMSQNNSAIEAAVNSNQAREDVRGAVQELTRMKMQIAQTTASAQEASHNAQEAYLKAKEVAARIDELSAVKQQTIFSAKDELEKARTTFMAAQDNLKSLPPTIVKQVSTMQVEQRCIEMPFGQKICTAIPKVENRDISITNPKYLEAKKSLDVASDALQQSEKQLEATLR